MADWPHHKAFCKFQSNANAKLHEHNSNAVLPRTDGIPPVQLRKYLFEDFLDLHRRTITMALTSAFHILDYNIDCETQHALFAFSYRPGASDPSKTFSLESFHFANDSIVDPDLPFSTEIKKFRSAMMSMQGTEVPDCIGHHFFGFIPTFCKEIRHYPCNCD